MNEKLKTNSHVLTLYQGFFIQILYCSKPSNHPQEDLAKFGYMLDVKVKIF
jgi:hypothetical protein